MTAKPRDILKTPLTLPCGARLANRLAKSAMSENLAGVDHSPTPLHIRLYEKWANGGIGLCITGNIMVDAAALGEPRNVVVEDDTFLDPLRNWAAAGTTNKTHLWAQLNHPGKQSPKALSEEPVAPSAIGFSGALQKFFNPPRALSEEEIKDLIQRFANTAKIVKKAGFTGVEIHGAHGYLVSQFLSPKHNQRTDDWGGTPENRMRFVLEVYRAIRKAVGKKFPIGIKLNSSDFMHGGFTEEESIAVAKVLADEGIDLIEISGGTYERPAMAGLPEKKKASDAEAYFIKYAEKIRDQVKTPLMITGGFRTAAGMAHAVAKNHIDLVGLARPMAIDPDLPKKILSGEDYVSAVKPLTTGLSALDKMALLEVTWYEQQLAYIARGKTPKPDQSVCLSLAKTILTTGFQVFQKRRA